MRFMDDEKWTRTLLSTFSGSVSEILTDIELCNAVLASMGFYRTTIKKRKKVITSTVYINIYNNIIIIIVRHWTMVLTFSLELIFK